VACGRGRGKGEGKKKKKRRDSTYEREKKGIFTLAKRKRGNSPFKRSRTIMGKSREEHGQKRRGLRTLGGKKIGHAQKFHL